MKGKRQGGGTVGVKRAGVTAGRKPETLLDGGFGGFRVPGPKPMPPEDRFAKARFWAMLIRDGG